MSGRRARAREQKQKTRREITDGGRKTWPTCICARLYILAGEENEERLFLGVGAVFTRRGTKAREVRTREILSRVYIPIRCVRVYALTRVR